MRLKLIPSVLVVVSALITGIRADDPIAPDCMTPDGKLGRCVAVKQCTTIMTALINNDHLTNPAVANFLRKSQCGRLRGSHEVCCDISTIDMGEPEDQGSLISAPQSSPSHDVRVDETSVSEDTKCGKLGLKETPIKWIGELWFETVGNGKTLLEAKCLGVLVSHKHLVVPAHCVVALPDNVSLQFVEIRGDEFSVSKIFLHAGYDKPKYANDIAVIEMDKECDDEGICIGYGDSSVASEIAIVKQVEIPSMHAKIRKTSESECRSHYNQFAGLGDGQFCAKVQSNDSDLSQILSVVAIDTDKNRRHTLGGFTSTAIRSDAASNSADKTFIFTDTRFHASWIKAAIGDNVKPRSQPKFDDTQLTATSCQVSGADGFCVDLNQCSLFREAPKPLSRSRVEFLKRIKCLKSSSEESNNVNEDGICCPLKYVELGYVEPEKQDGPLKRGLEALDLQKCGKVPTTTRIVGGNNAGLKEFPWIGLIKYKIGRFNKFTCGASLISSKHVLTCAHCVTNLPAGYSIEAVRLGEYDLSTDPDCRQVDQDLRECNPSYQDVPIAELIPHADYNTPRYANDIALVRLARAPDMKEGVIPICLPITADLRTFVTNRYTVAGFGVTETGQKSDVLKKITLPKVPKESCQSKYNSIQLTSGIECYGGEGAVDSCQGDSGNPLINYASLDGRVRAVQVGVVVAGNSMCGKGANGFPGIYTAVDQYLEWILQNIEE